MPPSGQPGPTNVDFGLQILLNRRRNAGLSVPAAVMNPTLIEPLHGIPPDRAELCVRQGVSQGVFAEPEIAEISGCRDSSFSRVWRNLAWRLGVLLLALIGFSGGALADGKVFPPTAYPVEVRIPDQRAILAWSNGVEGSEFGFRGEFFGAGVP